MINAFSEFGMNLNNLDSSTIRLIAYMNINIIISMFLYNFRVSKETTPMLLRL